MNEQQPATSKKVASNLFWRFAERSGANVVALLVSLVLARLLDPSDYGTIALVTAFITILQVFVDSGLGGALIQKKDADDVDYSSVFYFNMVMCLLLYAGLFLCAPLIAGFYERPELTAIIRVISLTVVISGVKNIQQAYVSKHFMFKRFFWATLGGTLGAAAIGITLAYFGFGVWALVAQNMFNLTVDTVILWVTVKWRPKWLFSLQRLKRLLSYGWKLLISKLINTAYGSIRSLIIGKVYTSADLAFYSKGDYFPYNVVQNINTSIDSVLMPTLSSAQDDRGRLMEMMRRAIKTSSYIMVPMMFGMAAVAEPMVRLILTEKWLPCVFYLRIFCCVYLFQPIQTANLNAIKAIGRSDIFLTLEIIKKGIGLTALIITVFISVKAIALAYLVTTLLSAIVNSFPNKKFLGYSFKEQIVDILPYLLMGGAVFAGCYPITLLGLNDALTLCIQLPLGAAIYVLLSLAFRIDSFSYILNMLKSFFVKKNKKTDSADAEETNQTA